MLVASPRVMKGDQEHVDKRSQRQNRDNDQDDIAVKSHFLVTVIQEHASISKMLMPTEQGKLRDRQQDDKYKKNHRKSG